MGFSGGQDKNNMGWWFLKRLEQGVGGFFGKHMGLVYDIDLVTSLIRSIIDSLTEFSDIINATIAGSIDLNHVQSPTLGYCLAHSTSITWFTLAIGKAVHCFSQDAPGAGLACSSWTTKKVSMRYTTIFKSVE